MNAIICTLLKYNRPYQLKLCLIDLKGGVELQFYSELYDYLLKIPKPKIKKKAKEVFRAAKIENGQEEVVDDIEVEEGDEASNETMPAYFDRREYVPVVLSWLIKEVDRRWELFTNDHVKKIQTYNQHHPDHMLPYVAVCFDEWADVRLERAFGAKCEDLLINISNRARASGIHVILCTQSPTKEVLTRRVMNAMNSRFVLFCVDKYMSDILLSNYDAANLDPKLHGRGFWVSGSDRLEVQSPLITDEMVDRIVADAKGGKVTEMEPIKRHDVTEPEIFKWSLKDENGGKLAWRNIYAEFRGRGLSEPEAKQFPRDRMNKEFEIDGKKYILVAPSGWGKARKPYRLLPIT
jgi:DNA segregation ATPase FtsK/SpoIIIE-like protein